MPGPSSAGFKVNERFIERAIRQEMFQSRRNFATVGLMPGKDFLGDRFQRLQMGGGIAVAEGVVADRFLAAAEQGGEVVVHENQAGSGWAT